MAAEPSASLFKRRLLIVTGKGGTGKTTVAAALAQSAARQGLSTLSVEVGAFEQIPSLLTGRDEPAVGYTGRELQPGLRALRIEPFAALSEYLGLQIGSRRLVEQALKSRALRQLLSGAPGWRELITLGKTWQLEQMRKPDGRPLYDLIVVDAPATGHGLTFLDVPNVVQTAVRSGPLARNARRVEELIQDPERTQVLPVSLAEELPVQETTELVERLRGDLHLEFDRIVVNAITGPVPYPEPDLLERSLRDVSLPRPLSHLPEPSRIAEAIAHWRARSALNQRYAATLVRQTGLPILQLPLLEQGIEGPQDLELLGPALLDRPSNKPKPVEGRRNP